MNDINKLKEELNDLKESVDLVPKNMKAAIEAKIKETESLISDIEANSKKVSKAEEIIAKANVKIKSTSKKTVASKQKTAAKVKAVKEKVVSEKTKAKAAVQKNKVVKEIVAAKKTAADILAKYKNLSIKDFNKGRSHNEIIDDLEYQAKAPGKRVSASGNTYYEGRPNRSDISSTKKLERGGSIENQYADKSAEEVWNMWTVKQRTHFLKDHESVLGFKDSTFYNLVNLPFSKLYKNIQVVIVHHVGTGEYVKGGEISEYKKGGYLYEIEKKGHELSLQESLIDAKNVQELKDKIKDKFGSLDGITARRRGSRGAFYYVNIHEEGGEINDGDSFHKGDKVKKRSTGEKAEVIRRNHNGNSHNESYLVKCDSGKEAYWWASDMEICYECGGMAYGGGGIIDIENKVKHINKSYKEVNASKMYSSDKIQVVSTEYNTLQEIKKADFSGNGLIEKYGNLSSVYVLYEK
jgi:hypothetical protein